MQTKLLIHAGGNKTGSTAIQRFLAMNSAALANGGVAVPSEVLALEGESDGQQIFFFESLFRDPRGAEKLGDAVRAVASARPAPHTIVLSAENLSASPEAPPLFASLMDDFDVRLLMYIRRQDEYLLSSWQQWYSKVGADFWAWALTEVGLMGDWDSYLQRWESVIPADQITVRVFERGRLLGEDVVSDFYDWLGFPQPLEFWRRPTKPMNVSVSDAVMDLVKGNPSIFSSVHDSDFYDFVLEATGDTYVKKSRQSAITYAQRQAILQRYADANQRVRQRYDLGSRDLFTMPREDDFEYVSPDQTRREQLEFLTTMVWTLHRTMRAP